MLEQLHVAGDPWGDVDDVEVGGQGFFVVDDGPVELDVLQTLKLQEGQPSVVIGEELVLVGNPKINVLRQTLVLKDK